MHARHRHRVSQLCVARPVARRFPSVTNQRVIIGESLEALAFFRREPTDTMSSNVVGGTTAGEQRLVLRVAAPDAREGPGNSEFAHFLALILRERHRWRAAAR